MSEIRLLHNNFDLNLHTERSTFFKIFLFHWIPWTISKLMVSKSAFAPTPVPCIAPGTAVAVHTHKAKERGSSLSEQTHSTHTLHNFRA